GQREDRGQTPPGPDGGSGWGHHVPGGQRHSSVPGWSSGPATAARLRRAPAREACRPPEWAIIARSRRRAAGGRRRRGPRVSGHPRRAAGSRPPPPAPEPWPVAALGAAPCAIRALDSPGRPAYRARHDEPRDATRVRSRRTTPVVVAAVAPLQGGGPGPRVAPARTQDATEPR